MVETRDLGVKDSGYHLGVPALPAFLSGHTDAGQYFRDLPQGKALAPEFGDGLDHLLFRQVGADSSTADLFPIAGLGGTTVWFVRISNRNSKSLQRSPDSLLGRKNFGRNLGQR